jgi:predicted DNA-binding transcriptional regulator YafY
MVRDVKSSRLVSLLLLLQTRHRMTAGELADALDVSRRTVYRDVEALAATGIPVYAEHGRAGGYRLVDGYRTRLTGLTEPEAAALFMVGLPDAAIALGMAEQTSSAELKLLAALAPSQREHASRVRDRFHLDIPSWYHPATDEPHVSAIAEAVLHDRVLEIVYRRWAEPREVERTIEPHGVVLKGGVWYVVARRHRSADTRASRSADESCDVGGCGDSAVFRTYRVSNILRLTVTEHGFTREAGLDLAEHWKRHLAAFDERRFTGHATVWLSADLVARLPDISSTPLAMAASRSDTAPCADGTMVIELPTESLRLAAAELVGYGTDLEVLDPPDLRAELSRLATAVARLYA